MAWTAHRLPTFGHRRGRRKAAPRCQGQVRHGPSCQHLGGRRVELKTACWQDQVRTSGQDESCVNTTVTTVLTGGNHAQKKHWCRANYDIKIPFNFGNATSNTSGLLTLLVAGGLQEAGRRFEGRWTWSCHRAVDSVYSDFFQPNLHSTPQTPHPTPCILHPTTKVHCTPYTLHPAPYDVS